MKPNTKVSTLLPTNSVPMNFSWMLKKPYRILALGFGSGLIKPGPGTWGSFIGLFIWWLLKYIALPHIAVYVITVLGFLIGLWVCKCTTKDIGEHDSGSVVWDEIVAVLILFCILKYQSSAYDLFAVILFRVFDIWKPFPIAYFDRKLTSSFGMMFDDVLAAVYAVLAFKFIMWIKFYAFVS
ncbi:phosphatidylglycerophosphatase A [Taylorella equigenitalis]|uniref:phosphatidylglycerophosphatase A family protein n=1 Tax=Taylorella equigenitalis TaxID=29575 RepID=UPI00237C7F09|nr:phosphatidylglycerophosphatase A [Taylorella equigenitalis]WDU55184.1 phosphatidylglycerophosphatase A [Taylorella equigenitalis]